MAAVVFLVLVAAGVGAYVVLRSDDDAEPSAREDEAVEDPADGSPLAEPPAAVAEPTRVPPSLKTIIWATDEPSTLNGVSRTWAIPRSVLTSLNPTLAPDAPLEAGARITVYDQTLESSISIGPPNNGRLVRGVPLPQDPAWLLPPDRNRAFATIETITAIASGLHVYAQQFPDAAPVQVGDLSVRRGGKIYGHQSHQTGLDVDIRLVKAATADGFDAERNWFLVKTLIDKTGNAGAANDVRAIFLNRTEQTWLRAAAVADVGEDAAQTYFELIRHEPGHTIHMHVRYACAKQHKRCVGYSLPDTDEQDAKAPSKAPTLPRGKAGASTRPRLAPKRGGQTAGKTKRKKKGRKKRK